MLLRHRRPRHQPPHPPPPLQRHPPHKWHQLHLKQQPLPNKQHQPLPLPLPHPLLPPLLRPLLLPLPLLRPLRQSRERHLPLWQ